MEKFTLEYKGFIITEPNMLLSDWVIALVCLICFIKLRKVPTKALIRDYRLLFITNGVGAFLGGFSHFFYHYTGQPFKTFAWFFIGFGTYYLQRIAITFARNPHLQKPLKIFSTLKLAFFAFFLLYLQNFLIVLADLAIGIFFIVIPIHVGHYMQTRNRGSLLTLVAIGIIIFSAVFPLFKISLHETWFTFNDKGHVLMAVSLYIIYSSAMHLVGYPTKMVMQE